MTRPDNLVFHLPSEQSQLELAAKMASQIKPGMVIFLDGDLGTGKTTFVRGFLQALGHTGTVKSPTYTLVEPYSIDDVSVYHFDLYRLADPEELEYAGGRDYFDGKSISLIEWPDKAAGFLPEPDLILHLSYAGNGRDIEVEPATEAGEKLMLQLIPDYSL